MEEPVTMWSLIEWSPLHGLIALIALQRLAELNMARRNEKWLRKHGAVEIGADHYPAIVTLHVLWFVGMIGEIILLGRAINPFWPGLLAAFFAAQCLRYWTIKTLGKRWTTRILVLPGAHAITVGPFQYLSHPNYIAVITELLVVPILFGAYLTGITISLINLVLLRIRIRAEEKGLREIGAGYKKEAK